AAIIAGLLHERHDLPCRAARACRRIAVRSFHLVPAEVAGPSDDVHFFETILADIASEELAGRAVKRKAPGIAQTVSPDLGQAAGRSKRIVRRDRVLLPRSEGAVHVDPQDLAEQR